MSDDWDRTLPGPLAEANALTYDYNEGNGVDFEPYSELLGPEDNASWMRAWTGNQELDGSEYRVFGQDGTGGYAAIWLARDVDITEQPIVFFGSEGELGVVARHLGDYLWLIAGGFGPAEAISHAGDSDREMDMEKADLAARHYPQHEKSASEVIRLAREEFPDFEESIRSLCK